MSLGPFPSERVYDPQFEELVANICACPQTFVQPATYGAVCAYLSGFDAARSGGPLAGLHAWLVVRDGDGNNLVWPALASRQLTKDANDGDLPREERSIRALGRLLNEFIVFRHDNGLTRIYKDYARWLLRHSWYNGPLRELDESQSNPELM